MDSHLALYLQVVSLMDSSLPLYLQVVSANKKWGTSDALTSCYDSHVGPSAVGHTWVYNGSFLNVNIAQDDVSADPDRWVVYPDVCNVTHFYGVIDTILL